MENSMLRKLILDLEGPSHDEDELKEMKELDLYTEFWADYTIWLLLYFTRTAETLKQVNRNGSTSKESKETAFCTSYHVHERDCREPCTQKKPYVLFTNETR